MEGSVNDTNDGCEPIGKAVDEGDGRLSPLDEERKKLADEFNVQRAKMKELFLQKEVELRALISEREQLQSEALGLRAQLQQLQTLAQNQKSEIESLQLLIHETVEASSSGSDEVRRLTTRNLELEQLVNLHNKEKQALQEASLAPGALVRSLARRLGADTDHEDAARKAQEDAELLRSLVEPLEEEIKALKDKLRDTDSQLQATKANKPKGDSKGAESAAPCDMCVNYERQLVAEQARCKDATEKARYAERALNIATEELEGARTVHEETVQAWRAERAAAASELEALRAAVEVCQGNVDAKAAAAEAAAARALQQVTALTVHRETLQETLDTLQRDNDMLVGKYTKKALELQNEDINLPDTAEELQEHCLKLREELIISALGREQAAAEAGGLRAQAASHAQQYHEQGARLAAATRQHLHARQQLERLEAEREQMRELGDKLHQANDRIEELLEDKKRLHGEVSELRARISSLQQDLDNSEKVQQDFVRLSQSLQVQLERIREADTEVRWQHEDDVTECPACRAHLPSNKAKVHCRHCGRIFCAACVRGEVAAGPRRRPARVCAVCRTLLQPHTPPYFSTAPPTNTD
ncbi:rab GTPase-binding effector protein 1 [Plutella xylostella]|uniref:rab GTPase-binding effector protein 1 n=1 Tax=Plutella xylostella TaxID=51655 RepID=UPI0020324176|nr:rab GTPase-binding effector protein 1 [Plutella xylostella]